MAKKYKRLCVMAGCLSEIPENGTLFFCEDHQRSDSEQCSWTGCSQPISEYNSDFCHRHLPRFERVSDADTDANYVGTVRRLLEGVPDAEQIREGLRKPVKNVDELIEKWGEELKRIYEAQTAGDHTFSGVLHKYTKELDSLRWNTSMTKFEQTPFIPTVRRK